MSQITIQCRLVASVTTRHQLWELMAEKNTPLINELLQQVGQHPDFETWRQKGKLSAEIIQVLCEPLKTDPRFIGQPGRFYASAKALVNYIYKSWLTLQQRLQRQLDGQTHWLEMLMSDIELATAANCDLDTLRTRAALVLAQAQAQCDPANSQQTQNKKSKQPKKRKINNANRSVSTLLFQAYRDTEDVAERCAIAYLLKNGCKVTEKCEDLEKFTKRRRSVEIRIQRLTEQLASRMPRGRDLTCLRFLESLGYATTSVPKSEAEARSWQDSLLKKPKSVPFPVAYETNEDMTWFRNQKGRLCVYFNGLSEHTFEVYCDRRQLHWFNRFLEDQQTKDNSKDQHSSGLFTLRSGRLVWQVGVGKGDPWNIHHLTLHCCVDTRLWTAEGTEQVRTEKAAEIAKTITKMKEKGDLNEKQQAFLKRKHSTLSHS